jgi:predicted ester cyclase
MSLGTGRHSCCTTAKAEPAFAQKEVTVPGNENRAVARRVLEDLVSLGRLEVVDQIYAPVFEFHDPTAQQTITTHEGIRNLTRDIRTRTPDIAIRIEEEIAEGDTVVHRWTATGHNAASGRSVSMIGISVYHLQEERIVSEYVVIDRLGIMRQLGIVPAQKTST